MTFYLIQTDSLKNIYTCDRDLVISNIEKTVAINFRVGSVPFCWAHRHLHSFLQLSSRVEFLKLVYRFG